MPVNSNSFNRYLGGIVGVFVAMCPAFAQLPPLDSGQLQWLGEQIYKNECNSNYQCLTSWNQGENFPSLGLGHFIWYRHQQEDIFEETFPQLVAYMQQHGAVLPDWLSSLEPLDSPWPNRESFLGDLDGPRLTELRAFLFHHQDLQAAFIAARLFDLRPELIAQTSEDKRPQLMSNFNDVAAASAPLGLYALIDYVHFKGTGLKPTERYQNQGWGLQQVLLTMPEGTGLPGFVAAAESVLARRVENAPRERNEARWLAGWINRLNTYLPP